MIFLSPSLGFLLPKELLKRDYYVVRAFILSVVLYIASKFMLRALCYIMKISQVKISKFDSAG